MSRLEGCGLEGVGVGVGLLPKVKPGRWALGEGWSLGRAGSQRALWALGGLGLASERRADLGVLSRALAASD